MVNMKKYLFHMLVENSEYVTSKFNEQIMLQQIGQGHYLKKVVIIVKLVWEHWVLKRDFPSISEGKKKCINSKRKNYPEYKISDHQTVEVLLEKLKKYDVISFDVFDTLIFRAIEKPTDLFRLLEIEWNLIDFASIRQNIEYELRKKKSEVTIYDIYEKIKERCAIPIEEGVLKELELEKKVCFANTYMYKIVEELQKDGKTVIAVSDMYLPTDLMRKLLISCGYENLENLFVSCDVGVNKGEGKLQSHAEEQIGKGKKYIHVGDNIMSDVKGSEKAGWDAIWYRNISDTGKLYRLIDMNSIASSFYKGIVNTKIHNGMYKQEAYYEFGFIYGGILVQGYCQFLERLAKQEDIDLFLFVARDGDVVNKACQIRGFSTDYKYIPFSRFASYQLTMDRYIEEFIKNNILSRVGNGKKQSIKEILQEIDLSFLINKLENNELHEDDILTNKNAMKIRAFLLKYKNDILEERKESIKAAEIYFKDVIGNHKNVCIVDIGWAGTGASCLKYFLEDVIKLPIKVCGALLGTTIKDSVSNSISAGNLYSYLFAPNFNKQLLKRHNPMNKENYYYCSILEIMFSANQPSFLKFSFDENHQIKFVYANTENNQEIIEKIQHGILDFVESYSMYEKKLGRILELSGDEAYRPIAYIMENSKYCVELLGKFKFSQMSGIFDDDRTRSFETMVKELNIF